MTHHLSGLHELLAATRQAATHHAQAAQDPALNPVEQHERGLKADELAANADHIATHIKSDVELVASIEHLVLYLEKSPIQSRNRVLAMQLLETASMRLRRELGDPAV